MYTPQWIVHVPKLPFALFGSCFVTTIPFRNQLAQSPFSSARPYHRSQHLLLHHRRLLFWTTLPNHLCLKAFCLAVGSDPLLL
jgi:hypothetical protein